MGASSAVCTSSGVFFSLISFDVGAFPTLPRAKPDDTAAERRSIPGSRNALAINKVGNKLRHFKHAPGMSGGAKKHIVAYECHAGE